ncbi:MAG TPA: S8 family serine peptidase [Gaiellaceae bacterium]|nr:S8 family serine peptidase [Gaiellaceae bacterium]
MKGLVPIAVVAAAAVALWVSAAGAAPSGSLASSSAAVPTRHIPHGALRDARPRSLRGVPAKGNYGFLLKLDAEPTARVYNASLRRGRAAARTAATNELVSVRAAQSRVVSALPSGSRVLYETHAVLAGVAVYTNVANLSVLRRISGVAAVYPIAPKTPSLSYSTVLVHTPQAWSTYSDLGANSTIAIIDTGVDYTHADLGGPGTTAAYQAARAGDTSTPTYPDPNKIVGGYDFAGDAYDPPAHAKPTPDPNPLDCDGHGTHVAGIAAGYGENPDGSTFTGNYLTLPTDSASYQARFRIGPGMAPQAKLYAYKVFGCQGSTDLIAAAIDRAADPNGDGNTSDHVSVINMSLGSDFTSPQDADSVMADSASKLGISVVVAAGNAGDLYDAGGSPGDVPRVISVANSVDAYSQIDTLHVGGPAGIAGTYGAERSDAYDWTGNPDLSGTVVALPDLSNRDGCDPLSARDAAAVKGKIAFLEWTDVDASRRCGSAVRSDNVAKAGASGAILADDEETFAAGIVGSKTIPVVIVTRSGGNAIRSALASGVTISGTSAADFKQLVLTDDDKLNASSSRGIGAAGDVKPDVTGVGTSIFSAAMGKGNEGISFSGTSMASPEVAGLAALVRTKHPDWTPEEVKADIVNTAEQDLWTGPAHTGFRYAPNRVGAGRIDAKAALDNLVLAYVTNDPGAVSASFGPVAVSKPTTLTKTIAVVNKGAGALTYSVAYDPLTQVPGATYSVSPSSVTVGPGEKASITLTLAVDPSKLTKPIDPTVPRTQAGLPRDYTADASGRVLLTSSGQPGLRVPVYAAPRPVARMTEPPSLALPGGNVATAALRLKGAQLNQGSGATAIRSLVAGFELQARSGALHACRSASATGCIHAADERAADLKYVATTSNAPQLTAIRKNPLRKRGQGLEYFAITTQGPWRTPALSDEYDILINSTGNKKPDAVLFNTRLPDSDIFVAVLVKPRTGKVLDIEPIDDRLGDVDAAAFDSDTLVLPVAISALPGVSKGHTRITYGVATYSSFVPKPVDRVGLTKKLVPDGTLHTDPLRPGIAVYGRYRGHGSALLYRDSPGTKLHVRRDASAYKADHGKGALIVHFQDAVGNKAQVVKLTNARRRK